MGFLELLPIGRPSDHFWEPVISISGLHPRRPGESSFSRSRDWRVFERTEYSVESTSTGRSGREERLMRLPVAGHVICSDFETRARDRRHIRAHTVMHTVEARNWRHCVTSRPILAFATGILPQRCASILRRVVGRPYLQCPQERVTGPCRERENARPSFSLASSLSHLRHI